MACANQVEQTADSIDYISQRSGTICLYKSSYDEIQSLAMERVGLRIEP